MFQNQLVLADGTGGTNARADVGSYRFSQPAAVPEPATMLLLFTGLAGVAAGVLKRRKGGSE